MCSAPTEDAQVDETTLETLRELRQYLSTRAACVVCLDLLPPNPTLYELIRQYVAKEDYQFDEFAIFRTVPAALTIRQYGMWLHLHSMFKSSRVPGSVVQNPYASPTYENKLVELKEALKWSHTKHLSKSLAFEGRGDRDPAVFKELVLARSGEKPNERRPQPPNSTRPKSDESSMEIPDASGTSGQPNIEPIKPFNSDAPFRLHTIYLTELSGHETKLREALSKDSQQKKNPKAGQMQGSALSANNLVKLLPRLSAETLNSLDLCPPRLPKAPMNEGSLVSVSAPQQSDKYFSQKKDLHAQHRRENDESLGTKRVRESESDEMKATGATTECLRECARVRQEATTTVDAPATTTSDSAVPAGTSMDIPGVVQKNVGQTQIVHKRGIKAGYEAFHAAVFEQDETREAIPPAWDVRELVVSGSLQPMLQNTFKHPVVSSSQDSEDVTIDWYECPKPRKLCVWALEGAGNNDRSVLIQISPYLCMELYVSHANVLLEGNYLKLSRVISQTHWSAGYGKSNSNPTQADNGTEASQQGSETKAGEKEEKASGRPQPDDDDEDGPLAESSVEHELSKAIAHFYRPTNGVKFHASGREDLNVRMLGSGRPFFLEFCDPKRIPPNTPDFYEHLTQLIHANTCAVQVRNLRLGTPASFDAMTRGIGEKRKRYRCVVYCSRPLLNPSELDVLNNFCATAPNGEVEVLQATPVRVLFRRTAAVRKRTISNVQARYVNEHWFFLDLETQAGTYVKEFVHSDRGRCTPSVTELLGAPCTIIQLDVTDLVL